MTEHMTSRRGRVVQARLLPVVAARDADVRDEDDMTAENGNGNGARYTPDETASPRPRTARRRDASLGSSRAQRTRATTPACPSRSCSGSRSSRPRSSSSTASAPISPRSPPSTGCSATSGSAERALLGRTRIDGDVDLDARALVWPGDEIHRPARRLDPRALRCEADVAERQTLVRVAPAGTRRRRPRQGA